jgi:uncharacterized protein YacL
VIFGAVIGVLANWAISDINISYIVSMISIILPHMLATFILAGIKVYKCLVDPDQANKKSKSFSIAETVETKDHSAAKKHLPAAFIVKSKAASD